MSDTAQTPLDEPRYIGRDEHPLSLERISDAALRVLSTLHEGGFEAYLVGGAVRDLLLDRHPKDFDISTNATPQECRRLFPKNSRIIGRRFQIVHVRYGRDVIEVSTFRAEHDAGEAGEVNQQGLIVRDNVFGDVRSDAWRRDFTLNALYFDVQKHCVIDYTGGAADIDAGIIRVIGDAQQRYREDPVRMIRAARFAAKLDFALEDDTESALKACAHALREVSSARMFDEILKLFHGGQALATFRLLRAYGLFAHLFPQTETLLQADGKEQHLAFIEQALTNTDARINDDKSVTPSFLYAALLWAAVKQQSDELQAREMPELQALQSAGQDVLSEQLRHTAIPKRFSLPMKEIWDMQARFRFRNGKRPLRLLTHPRFRAGYDFLCLRAQSGEDTQEACRWWTDFQEANPGVQQQALTEKTGRSRRPRRRSRKPRS